jgi:hypothetical protein
MAHSPARRRSVQRSPTRSSPAAPFAVRSCLPSGSSGGRQTKPGFLPRWNHLHVCPANRTSVLASKTEKHLLAASLSESAPQSCPPGCDTKQRPARPGRQPMPEQDREKSHDRARHEFLIVPKALACFAWVFLSAGQAMCQLPCSNTPFRCSTLCAQVSQGMLSDFG